ncbi:recombinase family protein [Piscibacillus sp. B03]|uniref:recombinase family protein n=1 Tax=Piscibacillus sp. B03 TaxID=3457430 RepID=UPI003FCE22D1
MKCAVYVRVSTDKKEQETSLINQQRYFYNIIAERGWDIYEFYVDVESGTKERKRKNFIRMIEDAKKGEFDVILAKELSRLARNGKLSYEIKEITEKHNIGIITFDGAINTIDSNSNNHMFGLYAWMYEEESSRISERIKLAKSTKARKGEFLGSIAPFGYKVVDKKLQLAKDGTEEIVRQIYDWYLEGVGFDAIARKLSKRNIVTPSKRAGKKNASEFWHGSTIQKILSNPNYIGDLVQHRQTSISVTNEYRKEVPKEEQVIVKNSHPKIINREDFEAAQRLMASRKKSQTQAKHHLFTNVLFCSDCKNGMWYRQTVQGYICGSYAKHGLIACTGRPIKEERLKDIVLNDIKQIQLNLNDEEFLDGLKNKLKAKEDKDNSVLKKLNKQINDITSKRKHYIQLLSDEIITSGEYREIMDDLQVKLNKLKLKKSEIDISLLNKQSLNELNDLLNTLKMFEPLTEVTNKLLHYFVERIEVDKDSKPHITYRYALLNE